MPFWRSARRSGKDAKAAMNKGFVLFRWRVLGAMFSGVVLTERVLLPGLRWYLRYRANTMIEEVNDRLQFKIPPFGFTRHRDLIERLVYDPVVLSSAEAHCGEHGVSLKEAMEQVERYAHEIVPAFNPYVYFRIGIRASRLLARKLYHVRIGFTEDWVLEKVEPQPSVVFVMNHRSNMDYVLLAYLVSKRTVLSYAAGEWARKWPLQQLVKSMGAFFVRRGSGKPLYRRVLERWVQMATEAGVVQVVFPEGGLSRDGTLREPRIGLLDYMLRRFDPVGVRDLVFIPVGINYDQVLEDRPLLPRAESGHHSPVGAILDLGRFVYGHLRTTPRDGRQRFGHAVVNFGAPVSMREYTKAHDIDFREMQRLERIERVKSLAGDLMQEVGAVIPVLPVPLIANLFVESLDEPLSKREITSRARSLIADLESSGAYIYFPNGEPELAIESGLDMLTRRNLVQEEKGLYRTVPGERSLLRYYANSIRQLMTPEPPAETFIPDTPASAPADG